MKAGKENKVLETGGSGIKEDGARTIVVEEEGAAKSESSISPPIPSPDSATTWGDSTSPPVVVSEVRWDLQTVKEEKEGIGKKESEDKREPMFERKEELRFESREEERLDDGLPPQPIDHKHLFFINPHLHRSIQKHHRAVRYGDKKKEKQQANNIQKGFPFTAATPINNMASPGWWKPALNTSMYMSHSGFSRPFMALKRVWAT
jgi:hypothetical protein